MGGLRSALLVRLPDGEDGRAWPGSHERDEHPKLVIIRLEANPFGVLRLLSEWHTLEAPLQQGEAWGAAERFRAFRLLGIDASDALLDTQLTSLLHACEVLDPAAGSLVGELWGELVSANDLPMIENQYRRNVEFRRAMDRDSAKEHLIALVRGQITRLEERAQEHREREEFLAELHPTIAAFDTSDEALLILRYEFAWLRLLDRSGSELRKRYEARLKNGQAPQRHYHLPPSPGWILPEDELADDAGGCDQDDCASLWGEGEAAEVRAVAEARRDEIYQVAEAAEVRNEPKVVSELEERISEEPEVRVRNEPKVQRDAGVAALEGGAVSSRNEPNAGVRRPHLPLSSASRDDGNGFDGSGNFARSMAGAMRDLERDLPVPTIRLASSGGLMRGSSANGGSRRERRRKKAEARARAKSS